MKRLLALVVLALLTAVAARAVTRQDRFPHEQHEGLFPLCTGCHEGVPSGDRAKFFPSSQLCAGCHNGTDVRRVSWSGPRIEPGNLKFSHPEHLEITGEMDCSECHTRPGAPRMAVEHAVPERCFSCHAPEASNHYTDTPCEQCHVPLAQTRFAAANVSALPLPPSHQQPNFLSEAHGQLARSKRAQCIVCHTRERCAACHVDAASRAEITAMPAAGAQLALPTFTARYFVPPSHTQHDWVDRHGQAARNSANCSACHTRESCETCHAGNTPRPVMALPSRTKVVAQGVSATRKAPASHGAPFFAERHGALAASKGETCQGCHAQTECEQCHNSAAIKRVSVNAIAGSTTVTRRRSSQKAVFHPDNFLQRHASAAYGRNLECSNCHDTSRFCRDCHEQNGMRTSGRLQSGFHDAQPFWLLNHAKPARQGLESCTSCHKQTDCMQCHSTIGAFRISPHGPSFDAKHVQSKNARICFACHLTDPTQTGTP